MDINYLKIQKIKAFDSTSNSEEGEKKKKKRNSHWLALSQEAWGTPSKGIPWSLLNRMSLLLMLAHLLQQKEQSLSKAYPHSKS